MISRRIAIARPLRAAALMRRSAVVQQRGIAQAGPDYPTLVSAISFLTRSEGLFEDNLLTCKWKDRG